MNTDSFATYHPLILFLYYLLVIGISMFYLHPVYLGISLAGALANLIYQKRSRALPVFLGMIPVVLIMAAVNPLFNHQGATMLFYLQDGNPVTLEAILYGIASACMLLAVVLWFSSFHQVMTADKIMYLFGKSVPAFSLLFSMTLRFVPRFMNQIKKVSRSQQCIGRSISNGNLRERLQHGLRIFSITVTWALENSVETADSMKSRGYGLRGRSHYSLFRFDRRDGSLLSGLVLLAGAVLITMGSGVVSILYYPVFQMNPTGAAAIASYLGFGLICFTPLLLNWKEDIKWHYLRSKI